MICAILPWLTIPDDLAPVPLSANINWTSLDLTCLPLILYIDPFSLSIFRDISISLR